MAPFFDLKHFLAGAFLATLLRAAQVCAQDAALGGPPSKPAQPWQIAGIRAAFGDAREPYVEPSPAVQHEALKLCAEQGWGAALDAQEVAAYLASADFTVRLAAVSALGQMGKEGGRFVKELTALLQAECKRPARPENLLVRVDVALGRMGAAGAPIGPEIVPILAGNDDIARLAAISVLHNIGLPAAASGREVIHLLKDQRSVVRAAAAMSLDAMGEAGAEDFADDLAPLLTDGDSSVRAAAACAMGVMGSKGAAFANDVAALLHDPELEVRMSAVNALAALGGQNSEFAALFTDHAATKREFGLHALDWMGKERGSFAPQVAALLKDDTAQVRYAAAIAIGKMGKESAPFASEIASLLNDDQGGVRRQAVIALGRLGEKGGLFAPELATLMKKDGVARDSACVALGSMGQAGAAFAGDITALLQDNDLKTRTCAARALGQLARDGALAPANIAVLLHDSSARARAAAIDAVSAMGNARSALAGDLAALLKDEDKEVRDKAIIALGGLGPAAVAFAPDLGAFFKDGDPGVRHAAADALALLDADQPTVDRRFIVLLGDDDRAVRNAAATALDQWGNAAGALELQVALLAAVDEAPVAGVPELRAHLRLWAGGKAAMQRCVTWLGKPGFEPMPVEGLPAVEMCEVLGMFARLWDLTEGRAALRAELAGRIARVAKSITGPHDAGTVKMLEGIAAKLKDRPGDEAARTAVESALRGTYVR